MVPLALNIEEAGGHASAHDCGGNTGARGSGAGGAVSYALYLHDLH